MLPTKIGEIVLYLLDQKISAASQTVATARIAPKNLPQGAARGRPVVLRLDKTTPCFTSLHCPSILNV